jgi:hypothetical protein
LVLDFFHHPVFCRIENTTFQKLDLFPSSGEKGRRQQGLDNFIQSSHINSAHKRIFTAVESSFTKILQTKLTHIHKFPPSIINIIGYLNIGLQQIIHNLSEHVLTDAEEAVLMKYLNFSVTSHSNLEMAYAVESIIFQASTHPGHGIHDENQVHVN